MAIAPATLVPGGFLGSSVGAVFLATASTQMTSAAFTNTDTSARTITVYIVRTGGAAGASNVLVQAQTLAPGMTFLADQLSGKNLAAGDSLQAFASTAGVVNAVIDGFTY